MDVTVCRSWVRIFVYSQICTETARTWFTSYVQKLHHIQMYVVRCSPLSRRHSFVERVGKLEKSKSIPRVSKDSHVMLREEWSTTHPNYVKGIETLSITSITSTFSATSKSTHSLYRDIPVVSTANSLLDRQQDSLSSCEVWINSRIPFGQVASWEDIVFKRSDISSLPERTNYLPEHEVLAM